MNCKLNFPSTIAICLIIIFISLFYAHFKSKNNIPKKVEEYYPYYPYLYKDKTSLIYPNQTDFRSLADGNLLVWNDTPINPLLVNCGKDGYQSELCQTIIGNRSSIPTSP
jgi:hypothetical protein